MPDLRFAIEERRSGVQTAMLWIARLALVVAFVFIGSSKFDSDPRSMWVQLFDKIGFGQWFRYFTGAMQIAGAVLMLHRRTITVGTAMLGCTMVGAAITDVVVVHAAGLVLVPLSLLGMIVAVWFASTIAVA
jgi:uncharacterized membrane protein YphA (DoxX/SURF4 family)